MIRRFKWTNAICLAVWVWLGSSVAVSASEALPCSETLSDHKAEWTELFIHNDLQSRACHSGLSDELKALSGSNAVLSHAVYHQILAGESFRNIPLWPNSHKDWIEPYEWYNYTKVFLPALKAAEESWDEGFEEGGEKHDFAVGWTQTVLDGDFWINEYRNRTGRFTGLKSYLALPGLIFIILVLIEAKLESLGLLKGKRYLTRYVYS